MQVSTVLNILQDYKMFGKKIYLSNSNNCPFASATTSPLWKTTLPFSIVVLTLDESVSPSKGDQPHLYRILSDETVYGLLGLTNTRSAKYPSRINPRSFTPKSLAGA